MAEIVELNVEDMIPELELMEKMQLFDKAEIGNITRKRREFEYKLKSLTKCKKVALEYIQYEMDLMKLIRQKRQEKGVNMKKNNVEYVVANRINKLFTHTIRRFQSDIRIWLSYIKFCKQVRFYTCASRILDQMLELHGDKQSLFKLAAQWEYEECQCVEKARKFLLNGLHIHKDSRLLYTEAFKLELNFASSKRKELLGKGEVIPSDDPVLQGKLAEVMYESAIKKINDVTFVVELLQLAKNYDFTEQLQKKILDGLVNVFPAEELTWDTLAKRELESLNAESSSESNSKTSPKERIKNCTSTYEKAVEHLNTEKMWTMYLDRMLELNEDTSTLPNLKRNCLTKAFFGAHNHGMMTEKYYLIWVDHMKDSDKGEKLYGILKGGTEKLRSSVTLWTARLRYHLNRGEEKQGTEVFKEAIACLVHESLPVWKLMIQYYQATSPPKVEELMVKGIGLKCPVISNLLKVMHLEWLTVTRGIVAARRRYFMLCQETPFHLEVHTKMLELEDMQPRPNLKYIRNCHHNTTSAVGSDDPGVWMAWVKFEQNYGDAQTVKNIHMRALNSLKQPHLVDVFKSEFTLYQASTMYQPPLKTDPDERMDTL